MVALDDELPVLKTNRLQQSFVDYTADDITESKVDHSQFKQHRSPYAIQRLLEDLNAVNFLLRDYKKCMQTSLGKSRRSRLAVRESSPLRRRFSSNAIVICGQCPASSLTSRDSSAPYTRLRSSWTHVTLLCGLLS